MARPSDLKNKGGQKAEEGLGQEDGEKGGPRVYLEVTADGVPLIAPVEESKESPAGSVGDTDQEVIVPPPTVGVSVVMVVPFSNVSELEPYAIVGATSFTTMVIVAVSVPPVLVAVIV